MSWPDTKTTRIRVLGHHPLRLLYPRAADRAVDAIAARRDGLMSSLGSSAPVGVDDGLDAEPFASEAPFIEHTRRMLRATLGR